MFATKAAAESFDSELDSLFAKSKDLPAPREFIPAPIKRKRSSGEGDDDDAAEEREGAGKKILPRNMDEDEEDEEELAADQPHDEDNDIDNEDTDVDAKAVRQFKKLHKLSEDGGDDDEFEEDGDAEEKSDGNKGKPATSRQNQNSNSKRRKTEAIRDAEDAEDKAGQDGDAASEKPIDSPEKLARTIFIGNVPVSCLKKEQYRQLEKLFEAYGKIESIRFRSVAFASGLPRKVAFINRKLHPDRKSINAYIVYADRESREKALAANATVFLEHHLRVDRADGNQEHEKKRSVFIGNLDFELHEEEVWKFFSDCGDVEHVRLIRDPKTNVGKGFGYVQFKERSSVPLALKLHELELDGRPVRIFRCTDSKDTSRDKKKVAPPANDVKRTAVKAKLEEVKKNAVEGSFEGAHATRKSSGDKKAKKSRTARSLAWKTALKSQRSAEIAPKSKPASPKNAGTRPKPFGTKEKTAPGSSRKVTSSPKRFGGKGNPKAKNQKTFQKDSPKK